MVKVTMTCLICNAEIVARGKTEEVDELLKLWDKQHQPCRDRALLQLVVE